MKHFKKGLALVLALCMAFGLLALPAAATDPAYSAKIADRDDVSGATYINDVNKTRIVPYGSAPTLDLRMSVTGAAYRGVYSVLSYPTDVFTYEANSLMEQNGFYHVYAGTDLTTAGSLRFAAVNHEDKDDGTLYASFQLHVASDAYLGMHSIAFTTAEVCRHDEVDPVTSEIISGMDQPALVAAKVDDAILIIPSDLNKVEVPYDGAAHALLQDAVVCDNLQYSINGGLTWSKSIPTETAVGDYTVQFRVVNDADATFPTVLKDTANNVLTGTVLSKITATPITITAASDAKIYDGTALTNDGYSITSGYLIEGDTLTSVTVTGSQTDVGSSDNVPSAAVITRAGFPVTDSYQIIYANGTLTVAKGKPNHVSVDILGWNYGDTPNDPISVASYGTPTYSYSDAADGTYTAAKPTTPGTWYVKASVEATANYEAGSATKAFTIGKQPITITADSDTKAYDGTPLTKDSAQITSGYLIGSDTLTSVTVTGSQTVAGTSYNVPSAAVIMNGTDNVTDRYDITYADGTLEVTKKLVYITADSDTKVYDGTALTKGTYTSTALGAGDHIDSVTVTGSQTVAGTADNVPSAAVILDATDADVTASYEINYINGMLNVTPKSVIITADSETKGYDSTPLTKDTYTNSDLAAGDYIESVTVNGSQTVVGSSDNIPSAAVIKNAADDDVSTSYAVTYVNGTLTVTDVPRAITITAASDTKVYDGTALTNSGYTITGDVAFGEEITSITVTGSQTNAGTSANKISGVVIMRGGVDVTALYTITKVDGTLEVTRKPLTITADTDTKPYDGTELTKNSYTHSADLVTGDVLDSVTITGSQTSAGSSANIPHSAVILRGTVDVTGNYEITYNNGTLTVTQAINSVTAAMTDWTYGDAPNAPTGTATFGIPTYTYSDAEDGTYTATVPTTPGTWYVKATVAGSADYAVSEDTASFTIGKRTLTITADSGTKVYDGAALTVDTYSITADTLAAGDSITGITITGTQTAVGTSANTPSAAVIMHGASNVSGYYDITYSNGTLEVTQKALTITADGDTKAYDGTPLTKNTYTNSGLAAGDSLTSVSVTGSQTDAGSSANVPYGAVIKNGAFDKTANYDITYEPGTLTVTQATPNTVTVNIVGWTYGDNPNAPTATADFGTPTIGYSASEIGPFAAAVPTTAGTWYVQASVAGTGNYVAGSATKSFVIAQKALTITADSDTKTYDGTALTKITYTNTGLAAGDSITSVTVTGSQTDVGTGANTPSAAVIKNGTTDVTANYAITYNPGNLVVTKKVLIITADSATKVYDGTALTKNTYTSTGLAAGDGITSVTVTGTQNDAGSSANTPSAAVIKNAGNTDVTANYDITYNPGTLTVSQKALTITADSATKVYDGTALTKNTYTHTGLAAGDSFTGVTVTGTQTTAGNSANVPSAAAIQNGAAADVTANYTITYVNGTLTVSKRSVIITAKSATKAYDGTALTKNTGVADITSTGLAAGDSVTAITLTGTQTAVGSAANVPSAATIQNAATVDVTANYDITYTNGSLDVTQKAIIIKADDKTKVSDDNPATDPALTATVTGAVPGEAVNYALSRTAGQAVGAYTITVTPGANPNYAVTAVNGTFTITAKPASPGTGGGTPSTPTQTAYSITVMPSTNGGAEAPKSALKGKTVKVLPAPDDGYRVSTLTVRDEDGNVIPVELVPAQAEGQQIGYSFVMPAATVTVSVTFEIDPDDPSVTGVDKWLNCDDHILYIRGYPDGSVQPDGNITRAETAVILYRLLKVKDIGITTSFSDVPEGMWYTEAIETLSSAGIINGYPDGTFRPQKKITRAEFTALVSRFASMESGTKTFKDLPADYWATDEILSAAAHGWIDGYPDGSFQPKKDITRAEAVTVINRMLNRRADRSFVAEYKDLLIPFNDLTEGAWYYYEMIEATNAHDFEREINDDETWTNLREQ